MLLASYATFDASVLHETFVRLVVHEECRDAHHDRAGIRRANRVVLHKRLLHRQYKVRWQILDLHFDGVRPNPSVRIESSEPARLMSLGLVTGPVIGCLLAQLGLFSDVEVLIDDGDEHLQYDNFMPLSAVL